MMARNAAAFACALLLVSLFASLSLVESATPLVSVIIPTYGRSEFLMKSLELLRRQDYPNLEAVIVDDSEQPEQNLPASSWIKYVHLSSRSSIGAKRNIAVEHARGEIIVHWDDDDYFREHRISAQVLPIIDGEADMTALEHHYYFHIPSQNFYTVRRPNSWGPHFATFVYRKAIFDAGVRYPDNSLAEDYAFAETALDKGYTIKVLNNEDGKHVYLRHHNTWQFEFSDYEAQIRRVPKPSFFSTDDYSFYTTVKLAAHEKPPNHFPSPEIKWHRRELYPAGAGPEDMLGYPPYYPKNNDDNLSTAAKIGIGVGVAGGVVLIVGIGIAAYFFFQWKKGYGGYEKINENERV